MIDAPEFIMLDPQEEKDIEWAQLMLLLRSSDEINKLSRHEIDMILAVNHVQS